MKRTKRHGTIGEYNNYGCRCRRCRRAWNAYYRQRRATAVLSEDDPRHGKYTTYGNYACRCPRCTEAWATYYRELKRRRRAQASEARQAAG